MAPVIHFQYGIPERHASNAGLQFVVEHHARAVKRLPVDTLGKYKVEEEQLGHLLTPTHLLACLEGGPHVHQVEVALVVGHIGEGHISIEELECLALSQREVGAVEHIKEGTLRIAVTLLLKVLLHQGTVRGIRNQMFFGTGRTERHNQQEAQKRGGEMFHITVCFKGFNNHRERAIAHSRCKDRKRG